MKITKEIMDQLNLEDLQSYVKTSKKMRTNMAGYKQMDKDALMKGIELVNAGGVVKKRELIETPWSVALKQYQKETGKFSIPKRGTLEYDLVKRHHVPRVLKPELVKETAKVEQPKSVKVNAVEVYPKTKRVRRTKQEMDLSESDDPNLSKVEPVKRVRKTKIV